MARKEGRFNAIAGRNGTGDKDNTMISVTTGKQYHVALYARLSVEKDGRKSDSIESQFMIMENFIKERQELTHYQKYFDRGVSGTTFDRPDFMRMMDDVRAGKIDCIIVKDLSRFGRDYLETGNYIETILPFLGVRFISVNDHFDTEEDYNGNKGLGISLMNLVNDMYAKDVSKRITSAFQSCMERGSVLGHAPYGYSNVKTGEGHKLVIDEPAAEIVRRIFEMAKRIIAKDGDESLRKRCKDVTVFDDKLWTMLDDMYETMQEANGVGLAAPQISVLRRVVVIDVGDEHGKIELINPVITSMKGKQHELEGCLSVPGMWGYVDRPAKVKVKAQDRYGKEFDIEGTELLAIALCHEIDHLSGILFTDKADELLTSEQLEERKK